MHEFSVTKSLVDLCNEEAGRNNIEDVKKIHLKVGKFTGFSPDSIRFYFEHLKVNTRCRHASIVFEEIAIRIKCSNCCKDHTIEDPVLLCPACGSDRIELMSGREFYVASIEGE
ncbi:MAG: hydrogenase maturation nickel metallochaperone HypA [candidate division WOR-3 bacterium]|nr:MAG: hydrogenase maturation nickel metallochaperone HypA [candidate division WOR-3 bacterium]